MLNLDVELEVKGMSCGHCEKAVKDALTALNGVEQVDVHLDSGKVDVKYDQNTTDLEAICEKIEEQGYEVVQ